MNWNGIVIHAPQMGSWRCLITNARWLLTELGKSINFEIWIYTLRKATDYWIEDTGMVIQVKISIIYHFCFVLFLFLNYYLKILTWNLYLCMAWFHGLFSHKNDLAMSWRIQFQLDCCYFAYKLCPLCRVRDQTQMNLYFGHDSLFKVLL